MTARKLASTLLMAASPQSHSRSLRSSPSILGLALPVVLFLLSIFWGLPSVNFTYTSSTPRLTRLGLTKTIQDTTPASNHGAMSSSFLDTIAGRRTWYALNKTIPISADRVTNIVQGAIETVPSAFNSQSNRAVVLHGREHEKLWEIITDVLKARVTEDKWVETSQKTAGFSAAAGTVLFFIDTTIPDTYAKNIPSYADQFPVWATQSDAMLQHTIWTALAAENLGANLQHYNPIIDDKVQETWNLPKTWKLTAQLVFGGQVGSTPPNKEKKPVEEVLKVYGSSK